MARKLVNTLLALCVLVFVSSNPVLGVEFDGNSDGILDSTYKINESNLHGSATIVVQGGALGTPASGDGTNITSVTAATGDSATSFFPAGTIEQARGGLGADVSGYSGLVGIAAGVTGDITTKAGLEGKMDDVSDFAEADGDVYTGTHDFGGATGVEIPNGTDPDLTTLGQLSVDSDGGNVTSDASVRSTDETNQWVVSRKIKSKSIFVVAPNDLPNAIRDSLIPIYNDSGYTWTITRILCTSDTDDTDVALFESTGRGNTTSLATIHSVAIDTNGTGHFYKNVTSVTNPTIETGHGIGFDFDDTDTPGFVECSVEYWINADVD